MNTAEMVSKRIEELKKMVQESGMPLSEAIFETAKLCVDWPYVWSAWGAYCTPSERRKRNTRPEEHPTIVSACQVLNRSKASCNGCKWYPDGKNVRCYDCRGFTAWNVRQYGLSMEGSTVASQWNNSDNWRTKGTIDTIPDDLLVCLFEKDKNGKWVHTGLGYKGASCECQKGVQYFAKRKSKWTHWAVPRGIEGDIPVPTTKPTLRKGDSGEWVTVLQTKLVTRGYNIGKSGVDSKFGKDTEAAVKDFQRDNGLVADGVCGQRTWAALDESPKSLFTVTIPHLSKSKADELVKQYVGATMTEEG